MSLTGLKQTLESIKAHNYCRNIALLNKLFYIIEFFLEYFYGNIFMSPSPESMSPSSKSSES